MYTDTYLSGVFIIDLMQTSEGDAAAIMGIEQPDKFVMKPQREGGGQPLM